MAAVRTCSAALNGYFEQTKFMSDSSCHLQEPYMAFEQASQMKLMFRAMACCNGLLSCIAHVAKKSCML